MTAKRRDKGLDRRREAIRQAFAPQQLGETVEGHRPSSRRKQDLEDLLRPASPKVTGAECAAGVHDRDRSKQPNRHWIGGASGAHVSCRGRGGRNRPLLVSMPERVALRRPRRYGANSLIGYP